MIFVGIDIAKLNHFALVISPDDEILMVPFQLSNDIDGFHMLVSRLDFLDSSSIIIDLESTVHYSDNLVASSFHVCVLPPPTTKTSSLCKDSIHKMKADKSTLTSLPKLL